MSITQHPELEWDQDPAEPDGGEFLEYWEMEEAHELVDEHIDYEDYEDDEHHQSGFLPLEWEGQRYHTHEFGGCDYLEDFEQYRPGGNHPVLLGDRLGDGGRFEVWHKLGQGSYGLVWLCRDTLLGKFCAVKVLQADLSKHHGELAELKLAELLGGASGQESWENHIAMPWETFTQKGPNGEHLCIVMPVLGPSITESRIYQWNNIPLLKDICFQLVQGMDFMHSRGLCHGDFRPSNILFKTTLGDLSEEEMERYLPEPNTYTIVMAGEYDRNPSCGPNAPEYAVKPLTLSLEDECITTDIAVIDFGVSFEVGKPTAESAIPEKYASPECQPEIGSQPSIGSDLWALGCTIAEVLCGSTPCQLAGGFSFKELELVLGPMPEPYRSKLVECSKRGYTDDRIHEASDPSVHALWDTRMLDRRRQEMRERHGNEDALYRVLGHEVSGFHPDMFRKPAKTTSSEVLAPEDRNKKKHVGPNSIRRRLDGAAVPGAVDLLRQVLRWFPDDRVAASRLLDHEWLEGRRQLRGLGRARSAGPTSEDILMEEIALPAELSLNKEDLPPPLQVAGDGAVVGPQSWRLDDNDSLHHRPFVPKSIWGFFHKALCVKARK